MSEKKYVVPDGMYLAALVHQDTGIQCSAALQAALQWLSENPIAPNDKQMGDIVKSCINVFPDWQNMTEWRRAKYICMEWQMRMFLAPESKLTVAEQIGVFDLIWRTEFPDGSYGKYPEKGSQAYGHNEAVIEAYRRGQKAGTK